MTSSAGGNRRAPGGLRRQGSRPRRPGTAKAAAPSARDRALRVLGLVLVRGRKPKEVLDELSSGMDRRDRAFMMEVVYGVLRYRDYLDFLMSRFLSKPSGVTPATVNNLRIGVYQAEFMRVPSWAIVNEAVELEKGRQGKAALVNAVLRNFLRQRPLIVMPPEEDPLRHIAVTQSHPRWLVRRWLERFGPAATLQLARADNEIPPLTLRAASEAGRDEAIALLRAKGIGVSPGRYSPVAAVIVDRRSLDDVAEVLPPACVVQDEASQIVSYLVDPQPGERIMDACAAPGGKTTHMAQLMGDRGEIWAVERDPERLTKLRENIGRLGLKIARVVAGDAACLEVPGVFDRILVDAPCSALGVMRRNPDVRYRYSEGDLGKFGRNQLGLLGAVSRYLRLGGTMVYSVCSTEPDEGEEVVREFLRAHREFCIIEGDRDFLKPFRLSDSGGLVWYRTFPHLHGTDGFFAARLRKRD